MTCRYAELFSSSQNMAPRRRRDPLPAAPARSELPDPIHRPASAPAGRGHPPRMTTTRDLCGDLGDLKRELLDLWTEERNTLAKQVMQDIEAQRKQRRTARP